MRRYLINSLPQSLLCSCLWLSLLATAAGQIAPVASSQDKHKLSFGFGHNVDPVPGTPGEYQRISAGERLEWFAISTAGAASLTGGVFSSALGTAIDSPSEYGPHWKGFGKRYGMRLTGISTGNAMEAGLGAVYGEDPRYFRAMNRPFGARVRNIVDLTFRAYRPDGERHLAYARYAGVFGNNFLSNTWRAPSEADWQHSLVRSAEGFGGRALSNTLTEFVPEIWKRIHHKPGPSSNDGRNP